MTEAKKEVKKEATKTVAKEEKPKVTEKKKEATATEKSEKKETKDPKAKVTKESLAGKAQEKDSKTKVATKEEKKPTTKGSPVGKKVKQKSRKISIKKTKEIIENRTKVVSKGSNPVFRGRFGKRSLRKKSNDKWNKWRFPRGIDVKHEMCDGYMPKEGFRTPKAIRDTHPSGFREQIVKTLAELEAVKDNHAIRISSGLGRKKKIGIVDKAIEKGIKVLNP